LYKYKPPTYIVPVSLLTTYHSTSSTPVLTPSWIKGVGKREGRGVGKRKEERVKGERSIGGRSKGEGNGPAAL